MGIPVKKEYYLNLLVSLDIMKEIVGSMDDSCIKNDAIALLQDLELNDNPVNTVKQRVNT